MSKLTVVTATSTSPGLMPGRRAIERRKFTAAPCGTSTPLGDEIELGAVKRLFGDAAYKVSMSSTKSAIGHLLGAAGAVESIFCCLAIDKGVVPPTLNLDNPSPGCDIDLVPHQAKERKVNLALSNSFGFGGTNASLVLGAYT